jgi:hypothetical protein
MAKSMAEKQMDAATKTGGEFIDTELSIYETSVDQWIRLVNEGQANETEFYVELFKSKGFDVIQKNAFTFIVRKRSLVKNFTF